MTNNFKSRILPLTLAIVVVAIASFAFLILRDKLLTQADWSQEQGSVHIRGGMTVRGGGVNVRALPIPAFVPDPTIELLLDEGTGTTSNNTGSTGDTNDCASLANYSWEEDPASSGRYALQRTNDSANMQCGTLALSGTATAWSIGVWINPSSSAGNRIVIGTDSDATITTGQQAWAVRYFGNTGTEQNVEFSMANTGAVSDLWRSDDLAITNGAWNHVLFVISGCSTTTSMDCSAVLYIDGEPANFTHVSDQTGTRRVDTTSTLQFGKQNANFSPMLNRTDKVQFWLGTALDASQAAAVYAEGR